MLGPAIAILGFKRGTERMNDQKVTASSAKNRTERVYSGAILALTSLMVCGLVACSSDNGTKPNAELGGELTVPISKSASGQEPAAQLIRSDYADGEISTLCNAAVSTVQARLNEVAATAPAARSIETLLTFEKALAEFGDSTNGLTFMNYVSTNPALRTEGAACEEQLGQLMVDIYTRRDLYDALTPAVARTRAEARLKQETLKSFEKNGLKLSDEKLKELKALMGELSRKETKFSTNLNEDVSNVTFNEADLVGVPADVISRFKKDKDGKLIVTTKSTDYSEVMENATNAATRKAMLFAYLQRGTAENTKLLEEAVALRAQIAETAGYANWADYSTYDRMAKSSTEVLSFLNSLKDKLAQKNRADLDQLLAFKKTQDPQATTLEQWDIAYYSNQLKKRDYSLDTEKIREYFPSDVVVSGMFDVYAKLLGVNFKEVQNANVWSSDVKLYEIRDTKSDTRLGYFYADFVPREGKYGHAAAFQLVSGRLVNGEYNQTVSSIVANFAPPSAGKPSLLSHDEVETIFHEFGHIMHQTLTRAPYASLSGSNTAQDFVEAPSQMLENWVWQPDVLNMISGHYLDHSQKLPKTLLDQMLAAKNFGQGIAYTKQLLYALFDMKIHTVSTANSKVDVTQTYDQLYSDIVGDQPIAGGHFPQTFGHLMGGYDAGYYGYLWSEVYAQDMFSIFESGGLLSPEIGGKYRSSILERGNMADSIDNLEEFLGRKSNPDAFFKKLGI